MAEIEKLIKKKKKKLQELPEFAPSYGFIKQLLPLPEVAAGLLPVLSAYQLWAVIRHNKVTNCWLCALLLICLSSTVHYMSKITVTFRLLNFIIIIITQLANLCQSSSLPLFFPEHWKQSICQGHKFSGLPLCSQSSPWANRISGLTGQGKENREEGAAIGWQRGHVNEYGALSRKAMKGSTAFFVWETLNK